MTSKLKEMLMNYSNKKKLLKFGNQALAILRDPKSSLQKMIDKEETDLFHSPALMNGFSFNDLSKEDFSTVDLENLLRIPFSTETMWPTQDRLPAGFNPDKLIEDSKHFKGVGIEKAHEAGYTGKGVSVAYIDKCFDTEHCEFERQDIEYIDQTTDHALHSHGYAVTSRLVGKNIGVAPDAHVIYYTAGNNGTREGKTPKDAFLIGTVQTGLDAIENIVQRVKNGEKIVAIGMSSSIENQISLIQNKDVVQGLTDRFEKLCVELDEIGVPLLDAKKVNRDFFYSHKMDPTLNNNERDNYTCSAFTKASDPDKVIMMEGGKCIPLVYTKNGYKYENAVGSASWCIPQVVGMFCMAKQANPDLTYAEFVQIAKETASRNSNGTNLANADKLIVKALAIHTTKKHKR